MTRRRASSARSARVQTGREETASEDIRQLFQSPGAPQGPRAFCFCPAGGIGIRTRLRSAQVRVRIPGGAPDFAGSFFYNSGCGKTRAGMARGSSAASPAPRRGFESRCLLHCSRRPRVRIAALQAADAGSSPAGNASSLMRGGRARRSGRRDRRFDSCRRDHQLSGRPRGRAPGRNPVVG